MITVAKRKLKARMPAYFRLVEQGGKELVVTDRGRAVLKVVPLTENLTAEQVFADLRPIIKTASAKALTDTLEKEWTEV